MTETIQPFTTKQSAFQHLKYALLSNQLSNTSIKPVRGQCIISKLHPNQPKQQYVQSITAEDKYSILRQKLQQYDIELYELRYKVNLCMNQHDTYNRPMKCSECGCTRLIPTGRSTRLSHN